MRDGFRDAISGWLLVDSFDAVSEHIEASAKWMMENGGREALEPDEEATVQMMIERQMVLAQIEGIV